MVESCTKINPKITEYEVGVFTGKYITPVADGYFEHLEKLRGENSKKKVKEAAIAAVVGGLATEVDALTAAKSLSNGDLEKNVQERMDISMHNFADFAGA